MSLPAAKRQILETMLLQDKPLKAVQIAKESGGKFPSVMMHLIGLTRLGYAFSPEKGLYGLTEKGKKVLGVPETSRENARAILADTAPDKAFHFYAGIGQPLSLQALSLQDFCNKILEVGVHSIEFHVDRGDFEKWFTGLGDVELAKRTVLLKDKRVGGEVLRGRLHELVADRCAVLAKLVLDAKPA